jgi:hypothetical protein
MWFEDCHGNGELRGFCDILPIGRFVFHRALLNRMTISGYREKLKS